MSSLKLYETLVEGLLPAILLIVNNLSFPLLDSSSPQHLHLVAKFAKQTLLLAARLSAKVAVVSAPLPHAARFLPVHAQQQSTNTNSPASYQSDEIIFNPIAEVLLDNVVTANTTRLRMPVLE